MHDLSPFIVAYKNFSEGQWYFSLRDLFLYCLIQQLVRRRTVFLQGRTSVKDKPLGTDKGNYFKISLSIVWVISL